MNCYRLGEHDSGSCKLQGNLVIRGPTLLCVLFPGARPGSHSEFQRKTLLHFWGRKQEKGTILKYTSFVLFHKACPQEKLSPEPTLLGFYQNLTDMEEGKYRNSSPLQPS